MKTALAIGYCLLAIIFLTAAQEVKYQWQKNSEAVSGASTSSMSADTVLIGPLIDYDFAPRVYTNIAPNTVPRVSSAFCPGIEAFIAKHRSTLTAEQLKELKALIEDHFGGACLRVVPIKTAP